MKQRKKRIQTGYQTILKRMGWTVKNSAWLEKDNLLMKKVYENGIAKGNFITYFPSGKIMTKGVYKNGENNGTYTSYSEDGKIVKNANMNNGVVDVTITYYDSNGNKKNQSLVGKGFDNYDKDFSNDYSTYESISTKIY